MQGTTLPATGGLGGHAAWRHEGFSDGIVTGEKLETPLMLEDLGVKLLWDQGDPKKLVFPLELYSLTEAWFEKSWWHGEIELMK